MSQYKVKQVVEYTVIVEAESEEEAELNAAVTFENWEVTGYGDRSVAIMRSKLITTVKENK